MNASNNYNRQVNYTSNGTHISRQKSSDLKYIKRTKSKQKPMNKQRQNLQQFKRRIANNQQMSNRSEKFYTKCQEKQSKNSSKKKQFSYSQQKNQSHKQNFQNQNFEPQKRQRFKNMQKLQEFYKPKFVKNLKNQSIYTKDRINVQNQDIVVQIPSRIHNNLSSCGFITTKNQHSSHYKLTSQEESTYLSKLQSLVQAYQKKDKFITSNYSNYFKKVFSSNNNNSVSEEQNKNMYESIKNFIEKNLKTIQQIYIIVEQIQKLNSSSVQIFTQQNVIKILKEILKEVSQLSYYKGKNEVFSSTLLCKTKQCDDLNKQRQKLNQEIIKLNRQIQSLKYKNDKLLSQQMVKSQKMSQLEYNLLILRKNLQQNKKNQRCNRETLDLQQQLKILGHQNTEQQREILQLKQQNRIKMIKIDNLQKQLQVIVHQNQNQKCFKSYSKIQETQKIDKQIQVNQMTESQRTNLELKIKIQQEFEELVCENLNLSSKINQVQSMLKQKNKKNLKKMTKTTSKLQILKQKIEDLQCQSLSIKKDMYYFFEEVLQIIAQNLEKMFVQNFCEVQTDDPGEYQKIYYQTTAFTDEASECKIKQSQEDFDKNLYQKLLQQKEQYIKNIQKKFLQLKTQLEQKEKYHQKQKNIMKQNFERIQYLNNKLKEIQKQKNQIQKRQQENLVEHSKNLNQNQHHIQALMFQIQDQQRNNREIMNHLNLKLTQKEQQINILKQKVKCFTVQQQKKHKRRMRICSIVVNQKFFQTQQKITKLIILNQIISVFIKNQNQVLQKKQKYIQTLKAQVQQNYCQTFNEEKKSNTQFFSTYTCQNVKVFPIIIQQTQLNMKNKPLKYQNLTVSYQKPQKDDSFSSYLQKFKRNSAKQIQEYLKNASLQKINTQTIKLRKLDKSANLFQREEKQIEKNVHFINQKSKKDQFSSISNNLKLVGSLYHNFDFKKGEHDQKQKDQNQFDLCI